jgi:hypothetical protein
MSRAKTRRRSEEPLVEVRTVRKTLCIASIAAILLSGCAGRRAQPIQIQMLGDDQKNAAGLRREIARIDEEIKTKKREQGQVTVSNIIMGVGGFFLIVPWFFMNFKDAEGTEIEALKQRKVWLTSLIEREEAAPVDAK